jgi:lipoyl-dependent peroxiredoxin
MKVLYTAQATVTGGRDEGHGATDDGALEVDLRMPSEMGGDGGGTNPEQLFALGYASCFESALKLVARRMKQDADDVSIDSKVMLMPTPEKGFKLGAELDVTLPSVSDPDQAEELVRNAHQVCPYSNATRGNIDVALSVNGRALDG